MNNTHDLPHQYHNVAFTENDVGIGVTTNIPTGSHEITNIPMDTQDATASSVNPDETASIPHQYHNVAFAENDVGIGVTSGTTRNTCSHPQHTTDIPTDSHEPTNIRMDTQDATVTSINQDETTSIPTEPRRTTSIPTDPEVSTSVPSISEVTVTIPTDLEESTGGQTNTFRSSNEGISEDGNVSSDTPQNAMIPSSAEATPNLPSDLQGTSVSPGSTGSTSNTLQPLAARRNHQLPNLTHVNPPMYSLVDNDKDVTAPPPPYWSIDSANDILASPTVRTSEASNNQALTTAPPPAYHTLYDNVDPPDQPAQNQNQDSQQTPEPTSKSRAVWLYSVIIGGVIPVFMIILKRAVECAANHSITESLIPGIVFHILHGLTTILTGGKILCVKPYTHDIFALLIFGWTLAVSSMIYKLGGTEDCDETLYYFLFCLLTVYNVVFGMLILYLIKPFLEPLKNRLKALCS